MFDRRSILKMLGCAPCAPLAAQCVDFSQDSDTYFNPYQDWTDGIVRKVRLAPYFRRGSTAIDIEVINGRVAPLVFDRPKIYLNIKGSYFNASYRLTDCQTGNIVNGLQVLTLYFDSHPHSWMENEHVHFRVEAD